MARRPSKRKRKSIEAMTHGEATRKNIPTAEYQSVMHKEEQSLVRVAYERRNRDLDPQLVWRGKDGQDWSDLVVHAPPLYIQEKVHPKALIDDLLRRSEADQKSGESQVDLFADFNGLPDESAKTEFYQHDANWSNRMILGDSLQVMASLAEREGLRGKVQCIYIDPPYGIKFNSNFQWSTTSRDVKDGKADHITREPEQVKAFRDTWRDEVHSYLTYLRDRLAVAQDLLTDSGSIFVQIGDENVHRVRALLDEVFGEKKFVSCITFTKTEGLSDTSFSNVSDYILWYSKGDLAKYRDLKKPKKPGEPGATGYVLVEDEEKTHWRAATKDEIKDGFLDGHRFFDDQPLVSQDPADDKSYVYRGRTFLPPPGRHWSTGKDTNRLRTLDRANRLIGRGNRIEWKRYIDETAGTPLNNVWVGMGERGFAGASKIFVVQTATEVIERCILMATDTGDVVLDPTCGSGTTAFVAERWGRRWITIDTSRVALALARARIMGARYPYYLLADSRAGQLKDAEISRKNVSSAPTYNDIRQGFVYERAPHITVKSIADNAEIDVIWEKFQETLEPLRAQLNAELNRVWEEWQIPREADDDWSAWAKGLHKDWWEQRMARQKKIDASIASKADYEDLYDRPYEDKNTVRVAGPFTVESLSPHRELGVDENDELIGGVGDVHGHYGLQTDFAEMILDNLSTAGVQQAHKEDKISFVSLKPWPGDLICAEGRYVESGSESARTSADPGKAWRDLHWSGIRHRFPSRSGPGSTRSR